MCQALRTGDAEVKSSVISQNSRLRSSGIRITGGVRKAEVGGLKYVGALDLFPEILIVLFFTI